MSKIRKTGKSQFNPFLYEGLFFLFKLVCKMLKEMGIPETLEKKAAATKSDLDDKGIKIVKNVIDVLGE